MENHLHKLISLAMQLGASYADVRIVTRQHDYITMWNGVVEELLNTTDHGLGIRVVVDGAWGFAGTSKVADAHEAVHQAVNIARQSARAHHQPVVLADIPIHQDVWHSPFQIDPRTVSYAERIDYLRAADEQMARQAGITQRKASMGFFYTDQLFVSSEGANIEQHTIESGAGIVALAADGNDAQYRSFPSSFQGDYATAGYEKVLSNHLVEGSAACAEEAVALLHARPCKSGKKTLIIDDSLLTLLVHESIGHALELDRVLGSEANYAGTSFATPEKLGNFAYASDAVTITADATLPGGLGSFAYDDEGTPAQRQELISKGLLVNYLTSRETAAQLNLKANGAMRADGWQRSPLIRMTNINLEPGTSSLQEMISSTDDGYFIKTVKTYSIDDKRLNFEFAPEIAWEVKHGQVGAMVKNLRFSGITPEFWNACDAVANADEWHLWGVPVCGKGDPSQIIHLGHGTAPARFQNIQIGG